VRAFLADRIDTAVAAGVERRRIIVDPGIGFGKRTEHNLALLAGIASLVALGRPVLVGPSRKRFIGDLSGEACPPRRVGGTIAACLAARAAGASIFRVHDVAPVRQAMTIHDAIAAAKR
jgi:dihydropteroate synthase